MSILDGSNRSLPYDEVTKNVLPEDTRRKTERCIKAAQDEELAKALAEIPEILALRNVYLHSLAVSETPFGAATDTIVFRGKHQNLPPSRSEPALTALRDRIGNVNAVLLKHIKRYGYIQHVTSF
ncbi:hypothetical protein NKH69_07170 [Mesorhizobium sp. M0976]|uniref:hypothetical protein n=1 Tax=unclassified Mesorhizobium TaxID=325217 RepID=UPI003337DDEC